MCIRSTRARSGRLITRVLQGAALATGLFAAQAATAASEVMTVTQLNVYRDGSSADWLLGNSRWLRDGFDNGLPLVGPAFTGTDIAATYSLHGLASGADPTAAVWESDSALHLDASQGEVATNAMGASGRSVRVRLLTNTSTEGGGLAQSRSFAASIRLSLDHLPAVGQSFGLRLTDGFSNSNDYVELSVFNSGAGAMVQLRQQDFVLGTVTPIGTSALVPLTGASQLVLSLAHGTAGSDQIAGSYAFADASGALMSSFSGLGSVTAFRGEQHTRLELRAVSAVPEPASALLLVGGGLLLAARRRRAR